MKFIRGMIYPNANYGNGRGTAWRLKWIYEFWGFCVNGTSSATVPGGFASNNGVVMPTNFTGGTSLMASGTDGYNTAVTGNLFSGECVFTSLSANFTPSMIGKAIVIWKPGSDSSEDSIYVINRVLSTTQLTFNINTGGTPDPTTKHPTMSARTGVCYRVVDMATGQLALFGPASVQGSFLTLNLEAATINPGQGNAQGISQIQLVFTSRGSINDDLLDIGISFGGSGQWDGTPLSITSASNTTPITITTASNHGYNTGQAVNVVGGGGNVIMNQPWIITVTGLNTFTLNGSVGNGAYTGGGTVYNAFPNDGYQGVSVFDMSISASYTGGQTCVNMIADKTFLIAHLREQDLFQTNNRLAIHLEVPLRLYPQGKDLHPLACLVETINTGSLYTSSSTLSYGGGFLMRPHSSDITFTRSYRTLVKAMRGDGTPDVFGQNLTDYHIGLNTIDGSVPSSDALLCLPSINNQYSLARVRLRTVKFIGSNMPQYHRIGLNGEFIHLQNGICWPWDNTIVPQQLLFYGSG